MASTTSALNPVASKPPMNATKLSLKKSPIPAKTTVKEINATTAPVVTKVKQESKTPQPITPPPKETEESQDLMPQPFIVKVESINEKPIFSIKEKFNIDCRDCQQVGLHNKILMVMEWYLNFFFFFGFSILTF